MNSSKTHKGWIKKNLSEVICPLQSGSRPKGGVSNIKNGIPSISGEHIKYGGDFDFKKIKFVHLIPIVLTI